MNVDVEWENFLNSTSSMSYDFYNKSDNFSHTLKKQNTDHNVNFDNPDLSTTTNNIEIKQDFKLGKTPKCSDIYISTKTKIIYFNQELNLEYLFWKIRVMPYSSMCEGVIKKQMKFISTSQKDLKQVTDKLINYGFHQTHIITQIDNPIGNIKFKDVRKITIGLSKKDILNNRCKQKSVFYNCFVTIIRVKDTNLNKYREIHVKIFNTGKLEIPGIQNDALLCDVLKILIRTLQPHLKTELINFGKYETVLINSNFSCGYSIDRHKLYMILREKYKIQTMYDPCSYPGIQCKFYYNPKLTHQTGQQEHNYTKGDVVVSFMIFRTGSVLIVGKCEDSVLYIIYDFLKNILMHEYKNIYQECNDLREPKRIKRKKVRKRVIIVN
jgi:hypothetical protein